MAAALMIQQASDTHSSQPEMSAIEVSNIASTPFEMPVTPITALDEQTAHPAKLSAVTATPQYQFAGSPQPRFNISHE